MLACRFQSVVFDIHSELNFITCLNPAASDLFYTLVNSHICSQCPLAELQETERISERSPEKRPPDVIQSIFNTSCSQCRDYQLDKQNCYLMHNSKTISEMLEDSKAFCPRHLW